MRKYVVLSALAGLLCASCGFQPMYGTGFSSNAVQEEVSAQFSQIAISNIPNREGQFLRNALIDRFYRDGRPVQPLYTLNVDPIAEKIVKLDITVTSEATRAQLKLSTTMHLIDAATGQDVLSRDLTASSSYNILDSEFANRVSEQNTRDNALNELARQIELQIALYLKRAE